MNTRIGNGNNNVNIFVTTYFCPEHRFLLEKRCSMSELVCGSWMYPVVFQSVAGLTKGRTVYRASLSGVYPFAWIRAVIQANVRGKRSVSLIGARNYHNSQIHANNLWTNRAVQICRSTSNTRFQGLSARSRHVLRVFRYNYATLYTHSKRIHRGPSHSFFLTAPRLFYWRVGNTLITVVWSNNNSTNFRISQMKKNVSVGGSAKTLS